MGWVWSEFMPFKETWNYQIFPILCYLGVKLTIVAKPQIPNNIPFWDTMYEPQEVFWHVSHMAATTSYTQCTHPNSDMYPCVWEEIKFVVVSYSSILSAWFFDGFKKKMIWYFWLFMTKSQSIWYNWSPSEMIWDTIAKIVA